MVLTVFTVTVHKFARAVEKRMSSITSDNDLTCGEAFPLV